MVKYYNYTTFDIIGELSYSQSFNALKTGNGHPWIQSFFDFLKPAQWISQINTLPGIQTLMPLFIGPLLKKQFSMFHYTAESLEKRLQRGTEKPDLMSYVMKNNEDMKAMSKQEMQSTFNILMIAGSETTATLLSGCTFMLQKNSRVLQKLREEVRSAFQSSKEITILSVSLPFASRREASEVNAASS